MKKKTTFLIPCLILPLLAFAVNRAQAQRTPGVQIGGWYLYNDIRVTYETNDPTAKPPVWLKEANDTLWYKTSIVGISGTNISLHYIKHFKNETEKTINDYLDIQIGESGQSWLMIIAANLQPNDAIYTSGSYSTWKINETMPMTYPEGERDTNIITFTGNSYRSYFWDKQTGVIVQVQAGFFSVGGEYMTMWQYEFKLTESNVWVVPEFTPLTLILTGIITLTSTAIIKKKENQSKLQLSNQSLNPLLIQQKLLNDRVCQLVNPQIIQQSQLSDFPMQILSNLNNSPPNSLTQTLNQPCNINCLEFGWLNFQESRKAL
jgi:hypothetical protein